MTRLLLAELLGSLIVSGLVSNQIVECEANPLGILVNLFFEYEWNNALHSVVERVIRAILTGERPRDDSSVVDASKAGAAHDEEATLKRKQELRAWTKAALEPLNGVLLQNCRLADRVIEAYQTNMSAREAADRREQGDLSVDKVRLFCITVLLSLFCLPCHLFFSTIQSDQLGSVRFATRFRNRLCESQTWVSCIASPMPCKNRGCAQSTGHGQTLRLVNWSM